MAKTFKISELPLIENIDGEDLFIVSDYENNECYTKKMTIAQFLELVLSQAVTSVKIDELSATIGSAKTYQLSVNNKALEPKIEIPEDKVFSSASVVDVVRQGEEESYTYTINGREATQAETDALNSTYTVDGKYVEASIANSETVIMFSVSQLVDVYSGSSGTTIDVAISSEKTISAEVKDNSLTPEKFSQTETFIFDCN